jgi:hypothetical protein
MKVPKSTFSAIVKRSLSSSSSSSGVTGPSTPLKSWERGAQTVQNTKDNNNPYLEHIRDMHDPSLHVKTIEDELQGAMGMALGKQGEKVLAFTRAMDQERRRYEELLLLSSGGDGSSQQQQAMRLIVKKKAAQQHNEYRKQCIQARWELMVHRQAIGFIVGNHTYVMKSFPIGDALPEEEDDVNGEEEDSASKKADASEPKKQKFGDQLDWWERIGRWK